MPADIVDLLSGYKGRLGQTIFSCQLSETLDAIAASVSMIDDVREAIQMQDLSTASPVILSDLQRPAHGNRGSVSMGEGFCSTETDEAHVIPSMLTCAVLVMAFIAHAAYMIKKLTMLHIPVMPRACEVSSLEYHQLQDAQQLRQHVQSDLYPAASALHNFFCQSPTTDPCRQSQRSQRC